MEHVAAIMLLLACTDDLSRCEEFPAPTVAYETVQDCETDIAPAMREAAIDAPTILGRCLSIDPALFAEDVEIAWSITAEGELAAELALVNPDIPPTLYADASAMGGLTMTDAVYESGADAKGDRLAAMPEATRFGR